MRDLYMKTGQGFLLVFSITSPSSLSELADLREQIIRIKDDENVPIVIVGNKSDLEDERKVSRAKAFGVSQNWGNAPYYETSARRRGASSLPCSILVRSLSMGMSLLIILKTANVDEVFIDLCRQIIRRDNAPNSSGMAHPHDQDDSGGPAEKPPKRHRHRRRMGRRRDGPRCTIL